VTARTELLGVRLGFVLFGGFWGTWAVAALDIQRFLDLSDAGLGVLVASTVVGTSVANVAGGALAERRGTATASAASLAVWGVLVLVVAGVPGPGAWMAAFLAVVAAGGMLDVVLNVASTAALAARPGALLRVHASYNIGTILGAASAGATLAVLGTWRWPLAAFGVGALVLASRIASGAVDIPAAPSAGHATLRDAAAEVHRSGLHGMALAFALGAMVEGGIGTFGVLYLRDRLDVAVLAGAGAYVAGQALATTTRFALGSARAGAHLTGPGPARIGLLVAGVGLALEAATEHAGIAGFGLAVAAIGAATYWPLLSALVTRASERPGLAVGGVSAAGYLGFLAGPPIVGAIAEGAGLRAGVLALAFTGALAAAVPLGAAARATVGSKSDDGA
jgi:MFS family permease